MTYKQAIDRVAELEKGYLDALYKEVDPKIVTKMELTGLIQKGQESDRKETWKVTTKGKKTSRFANISKKYQPSTMEKIQGFVNGLILNKKSLSV